MMEKSLSTYQKIILIILLGMSLFFCVMYPLTINKVGFSYQDEILVLKQEDGKTIYSGKIDGKEAQFVVSDENTVDFTYGDKNYGQYRMIYDSSAIPEDSSFASQMTGVEITHGNQVMFRGGAFMVGDDYRLYNEDDTIHGVTYSYITNDGIEVDQYGNVIDKMKPTASTIYTLLNNPKMTHKGDLLALFTGLFICFINTMSIIYADELFRWNLSFQIRNSQSAEPSEWELASRCFGWTVLTVAALFIFVLGLK